MEKLDHPALGEQLRPYITDISRKFEARHFAIELAELCEVRALQDNLVGVALNSAEHITLRVDAAYAVVSICDIATRAKLKPLIYADTDPNDELKGCGLMAVWPETMAINEILPLLIPPQKDNFVGLYRFFLGDRFIRDLSVKDIPAVLAWIQENDFPIDELHDFGRIGYQTILKSLEYLDEPEIFNAFINLFSATPIPRFLLRFWAFFCVLRKNRPHFLPIYLLVTKSQRGRGKMLAKSPPTSPKPRFWPKPYLIGGGK